MQDTYISDEGKGFPLVLVHGFLGSSIMWKRQIDFFKDYFRVITPDLPGYGKSNKAKSHNTIQSIANLLLDCLGEKKIDKFKLDPTLNWKFAEIIDLNVSQIKFRIIEEKNKKSEETTPWPGRRRT